MFISSPKINRATARVRCKSSIEGSGARAIRVPGLARNGWTITSWMWPYFSWRSRMASSESTRSSAFRQCQ